MRKKDEEKIQINFTDNFTNEFYRDKGKVI